MTRWPILLVLLATPLLGTGCETSPRVQENADLRVEVEGLNRLLEQRFGAGDLRGVAAMYADDAILISPGGDRVEGRAAIDAYWAEITDPRSWTLEVLSVEGGERLVVQRGISHLAYAENGEERLSTVDFVLVWVREEDGRLRVAVDAYW